MGTIDPSGKDAPSEITERASRLVAAKDYAGIQMLIEKIDGSFRDNHGPDYFRNLLTVLEHFK
jgi:hypothetical protein